MQKIILFLSIIIGATFISNAQILDYQFKNVNIGGGGYITGMKIHPNNADVKYWRTDIGGAYKWNVADGKMQQIIHYGEEWENLYSIAGIALHPTNDNEVFLAADRKCKTDGTSGILHSTDYGDTWTLYTNTNVYFGGNGGRDCQNGADKDRQGSPIAVNPNNPNELYIGTRSNGLWKLDVSNGNFTQLAVGVIPTNTNYKSIRAVKFHPTSPQFVFIGYQGLGIYMGETNLNSYWKIDNGNADFLDVANLDLSKDGDYLFVPCKKSGLWRATNPTANNRIWDEVLTYNGANRPADEAFLVASCSPHDNLTVITVYSDYDGINTFKISTDGGNNWTPKTGSIGNNIFDWRDGGVFASHVSAIEFDPVNQSKIHYTSWFSTFETDNFNANPIVWYNDNADGHEETVTTDVVPFNINPATNFVGFMGGDASGHIANSIVAPAGATIRSKMDDGDDMVKGASIDVCESYPSNMVVSCTKEWSNSTGGIAYSINGGNDFIRSTGYTPSNGKAVVAMASANPNKVVVAHKNGIEYSNDYGDTFAPAAGTMSLTNNCTSNVGNFTCLASTDVNATTINQSVFSVYKPLAADKVHSCLFYYYDWDDGSFSVSTDHGGSWCVVSQGVLPTWQGNNGLNQWAHKTRVTTIPGFAKHVWINFNSGLWQSTDGGVTWNQLGNVSKGNLFTFGKTIAGNAYPTLFLYGKANGDTEFAYYKSEDEGISWQQINDPSENEIWGGPRLIAGDRNEEGRLYIGTSGLGLIYGDAAVANCNTPDFVFDPIEQCALPITTHESSGIIANDYGDYWLHNDAENTTEIFQMDANCNVIRTIDLTGAHNYDWEDACKDDDGNFYIGEIGSRNGQFSPNGIYDQLFAYKIPNPRFHCANTMTPEPIEFNFQSSVKDCESMFYWDGWLYFISKHHSNDPNNPLAGVAELHKVPAIPNQPLYTADYVASLTIHDYPCQDINTYKVTSADLSPDGSILVMMGEARMWILTDFTPGVFFDGSLTKVEFNIRHQREAVTFVDNHTIYIADENRNHNSATRGNFAEVDLCQFIPNHPNCDCTASIEQDKADTYQDAVEEDEFGAIDNGSSDLELCYENNISGYQHVGLRFNMDVPRGANIKAAYIQFTSDETNDIDPSNLTIWGENVDQSAPFANVAFNVSGRQRTNANVQFSFNSWNDVLISERDQRTADISIIVQEIVNRSGWQAGNDMAFIIAGQGRRVAENRAYCNGAASPLLIIEYCEPAANNCPTSLFISEPDILSGAYHTTNYTGSNGKVLQGSNVHLKSNNCVELVPNFEVKQGAEFLGDIVPCSPQ